MDTISENAPANLCRAGHVAPGIAQAAEILAIIPARGGSKGLPNKNIRPLAGKPLLAYSIEAARQDLRITRIIVSTDSQKIADCALAHGAEVPFLRPYRLSSDKADLGLVINHMLWSLARDGYMPDAYVVLYPTSPLRSAGLVHFMVDKLVQGHSSVLTAKAVAHRPEDFYLLGGEGKLARACGTRGPQRSFALDAEISVRHWGLFSGRRFLGVRPPYLHIVSDPMMLVDIDSIHDFRLAETLVKRGLFDFSAGYAGH